MEAFSTPSLPSSHTVSNINPSLSRPLSVAAPSSCLRPLLEELLRTVGIRLDGLLSRHPSRGASLPLMRVSVLQSLHGPDDLVDAAAGTVVIDSHGAHHARRVDDEYTCE
jgi:hypothetical protein